MCVLTLSNLYYLEVEPKSRWLIGDAEFQKLAVIQCVALYRKMFWIGIQEVAFLKALFLGVFHFVVFSKGFQWNRNLYFMYVLKKDQSRTEILVVLPNRWEKLSPRIFFRTFSRNLKWCCSNDVQSTTARLNLGIEISWFFFSFDLAFLAILVVEFQFCGYEIRQLFA